MTARELSPEGPPTASAVVPPARPPEHAPPARPPEHAPPARPPEHAPRAGSFHALGLGLTLGVHLGVIGLVVVGHRIDTAHIEQRAKEPPIVSIEAGLAIKRKSTAGVKSRLPQKDVAPKVKPPPGPTVAKNPEVVPKPPEQPEPKDEPPPPPEAIDPKSVFDKFRKVDTGEAAATEGGQRDELNQEGRDDGHEWGTLDDAKGDPYVGELYGRMAQGFEAPKFLGTGLKAMGCVKLHEDGRLRERWVPEDARSPSAPFNSAVERRLLETTDMPQPVPDHLKQLLTVQGLCVPYAS